MFRKYDRDILFSKKDNFIKIYDGYHSTVYRYNDVIIKYIKNGDIALKNEINIALQLNEENINTHYIIDYSIDEKWIVYDYIDLEAPPTKLSVNLYNEIFDYIKYFSNIKINILWDNYKYDCINALSYFEKKYGESVYKKLLIESKGEIFIHGDLNQNNFFYSNNQLFIIDYENACFGPAWWDRNYLISEYFVRDIDNQIFEKINKIDFKYILLIKQIRIGRLIRKRKNDHLKYEDYKEMEKIYKKIIEKE